MWDVLRMKPATSVSNQLAGVTTLVPPSAQVRRAAAQAAALVGALLVITESVLVPQRVAGIPGFVLAVQQSRLARPGIHAQLGTLRTLMLPHRQF